MVGYRRKAAGRWTPLFAAMDNGAWRTFEARVDRRRDFAGIQTELRRDHIAICAGHPAAAPLSLNERLPLMYSEAAFMFNVTTSRPSRRKLRGARPPVCAGLSYPDGRGRLGLPWGYPGATPGGHTISAWGAERPYFTGLSRGCFKVAEREEFSLKLNKFIVYQ